VRAAETMTTGSEAADMADAPEAVGREIRYRLR
jgi:hypothetical protein